MLSLSRRTGESIMIGHNVKITVVEFRGDKVVLGIEAPKRIKAHRLEVYERIQREKAERAMLGKTKSKAPRMPSTKEVPPSPQRKPAGKGDGVVRTPPRRTGSGHRSGA